jgi:hypothetical protein
VQFKYRLNGLGVATNATTYENMRKYKLMNLFNIQRSGDCIFITSRWQICVHDIQGFGNDVTNKKHTLRSLSLSLGMTGGAIVRLDDDSLDVDGLPKGVYSKIPVEPKSGGDDYYDFLVEYNLFLFVTKAYNTLLSKLSPVDKGVIEKYFDMTDFDIHYTDAPPGLDDATFAKTDKVSTLNPYVMYYNVDIHNVSDLYNYGHIYDVMTYHFFAEPDYEEINRNI